MINKLLDKIFPKTFLFMILSPNLVQIKNLETGESISKKAIIPFSNDRLIIADFVIAEEFLRSVLDEFLNQNNKTFRRSLKVVLQIRDKEKPIVTNVENRIYQDLVKYVGASHYWLIEHQNEISDEEIINISK